jgi:hypothetical protein
MSKVSVEIEGQPKPAYHVRAGMYIVGTRCDDDADLLHLSLRADDVHIEKLADAMAEQFATSLPVDAAGWRLAARDVLAASAI